MAFEFVPLGVGDAFSARWYSSCLLIECDGSRLLIDCPHPIRKMLREATGSAADPVDLDGIDAVVLTHLHGDHCSGLEGAAFFWKFALGRRLPLAAHPSVLERLWDDCLAAGMDRLIDGEGVGTAMGFEDYFDPVSLRFEEAIELGPFRIECRTTVHHVPTTALRIHTAQGSFGYSADTAFDRELIDWLAECDRFVHETNLGTHTAYERLAALPVGTREKMKLIHFTDDFDLTSSVIEPLEQGRRYQIVPD